MGQQGLNDFQYPQLKGFKSNNQNTIDLGFDPKNEKAFDSQKFNQAFEKQKALSNGSYKDLQEERLGKLNVQNIEQKPYQLSFMQILINIKDTWFELIDDILNRQFYVETFTKKNRMFYIGITIIFFVICMYLYDIIFDNIDEKLYTNSNYNNKNKIDGKINDTIINMSGGAKTGYAGNSSGDDTNAGRIIINNYHYGRLNY